MSERRVVLFHSRYSFLVSATQRLLQARGLDKLFAKVVLNKKDESPHLFKLKTLKDLKIDCYFEDDLEIVNYLRQKLPKVRICTIGPDCSCQSWLK